MGWYGGDEAQKRRHELWPLRKAVIEVVKELRSGEVDEREAAEALVAALWPSRGS